MELMKKKISQKVLEEINAEQMSEHINYEKIAAKVNPLDILKNYEIPKTLEYRLSMLPKIEQSHLLGEIADQGSAEFANQILKNKNKNQQFESISLVASQFLSFKEIGDQLLALINSLLTIQYEESLEEIILFVSRSLRSIYQSERCYLWMSDEDTGVLYTLQDNPIIQTRAIYNKGTFGEVFKFQRSINKKERDDLVLAYLSDQGENKVIRVRSTLCIPVYNGQSQDGILGILELSNSKNSSFSYDE